MKNILIADDQSILRQGLKRILSKNSGFTIVAEAGSIPELRNVLSKVKNVDVLTLDLSMPGGSGLDALKEIKTNYPELAVLILSQHSEEQLGLRTFKAGASGYLSKFCTPEQLVESVNTISLGRRFFGKITEDLIFNELNKKAPLNQVLHNLLSDRELHVFMQLGQGKSLTQIGKDLSISVKTVGTYRSRILNKMKMKTNAQMVEYSLSLSLSL